MAVYEHTYQSYTGPLTPTWSRFLVIPRYAYRSVFQSKLFAGLFALCFVPPLIAAIMIYLHHNTTALAIFEAQVADLIQINTTFFLVLMAWQWAFSFVLTVIIAPALISRDLTNNALPLYLCRPLTRAEYVLGKMAVVMIMVSVVTWVPGLLLFAFQGVLAGAGWMAENLWLAGAIFVSSWACILLLALFSQALSAWIKWRTAASGALFLLAVGPLPLTIVINEEFPGNYGTLLSPSLAFQNVACLMFRVAPESELAVSGASAWLALAVYAAIALFLLARKVRAYEVIK
jgi:ABC-2 type transport system permease protein